MFGQQKWMLESQIDNNFSKIERNGHTKHRTTICIRDQVTSQKLMDIAGLATFDDPADESTIKLDSTTGKLKVRKRNHIDRTCY